MNVRNVGKKRSMIKLVVINSKMELFFCDLVGFDKVKKRRLRADERCKSSDYKITKKVAKTNQVQSYAVLKLNQLIKNLRTATVNSNN